METHKLLIVFLLMAWLAGGCGSPPLPPTQPWGGSTPTPTPPSGEIGSFSAGGEKDIYRLGPGDIIKIKVYEEPDISGNFRVSKAGQISWSWVGKIKVAGDSIVQISQHLEEILRQNYIRRPRIEVQVAEYHSQVVYFFGNIANPGVARLGDNKSLLQNLLLAGGPRVWGDSRITILKNQAGGNRKIQVSLQSLLRGEKDVLLENRDIVTVAAAEAGGSLISENRVYVVGAVHSPTSIPWKENMTALDALMEAHGLAENASGNRARLVRGQGEEKIDYRLRLDDILDGDKDKNILLLPGDQIIVPESFF